MGIKVSWMPNDPLVVDPHTDGLFPQLEQVTKCSISQIRSRIFLPWALQAAKRRQSVRASWALILERVFFMSFVVYFHLKGLAIWLYNS